MKSLACRFKYSFSSIFKQVAELLDEIRRATAKKIARISDEIIKLQRKATREAREQARKLQIEKEKLQRQMQKYKVSTE
jgi:septation ring formation regulator EzrA